ncbi:MAG: universal stress protein [Desulfuromonadales bacterium]|nr:universal stress protein [Desulfuromonadales bacterium]
MFRHFLVPLDGSRMAEAALPVAVYLAQKLGARVTLMHVVEKNAPSEVHGQSHLKTATEANAYLKAVSERFFSAGLQIYFHVHETEVSDVAGSIVAHADELNHDLVVMCSHGRGKALHLFLGSIAQKVIGKDSRPVLIAHPDERGEAPDFSCRSILVPLDGDPGHAQALPVSRELAQACGATLLLAMVIPHLTNLAGDMAATGRMLPGTTSRMLEMASQEAEEYLASLLEALRVTGVAASAQILRGDPAKTIEKSAKDAKVDLIVLATHGKTGMEAFWSGSVAHKICGYRGVPLLLIPIERSN